MMRFASVVWTFAFAAGLFALGASRTRAQSEINPDQFGSPNTEPIPQPKVPSNTQSAAIQYDGKFVLPYTVQCSGKSLPPGSYSLSLRSDGKVGHGTVKSKDQTVAIVGTVHKGQSKRTGDALIVETRQSTRTLSVIQLAEVRFLLQAGQRTSNTPSGNSRRIESLPLTVVSKRQE